MNTWYEQLGFAKNPFTIKPGLFTLRGRNDISEQVKTAIFSGKICILEGTYGSGKTSMLQEIIDEYKGKRKVVYFACNRLKSTFNVDKILLERSLINKIFNIKAKNMIILLDEAEHLEDTDIKKIIGHHKKGFFKSVVFITHDRNLINLKESTDPLVFNFSQLEPQTIINIVRDRVGETPYMPDDVVLELYSKSKSMRSFLKTCEQFMKHCIHEGKKKATLKDAKTFK